MNEPFDSRPLPFATLPDALAHWGRNTPDALAVTSGTTELTYGELLRSVAACAARLAELGVSRGDRVVIVGHNTPAWIVHYMAVLWMGAVVAPANNRLNVSQFADQVELLDAALVLTDDAHRELAAGVPPERVRALGLPNAAGPALALSARAADPGLISFTSGTTGKPKGAVLTQSALAEASWAFVRVLQTRSEDSTLVMVPMFHNTGFVDQFGHMLAVGGRTDLLYKFRAADAVAALKARPVSYLAAVPSIIRLLMVADGALEAMVPVRTILYGGSPMPAAWIDELLERWPALRLFHGYGMTEYGSAVSFLRPEYAHVRGESVGHVVPFTSIRLVDEHGDDVAAGSVGELWVRGPTMMQGYWLQPELTANKISNGWLETGDLAREEDGFLYIEGRVDDVINRGGEKVLPAFVESILAEIESVGQSCVFGVSDSILQQRVWAAVEERPGSTFRFDEARSWLTDKLPNYAIPERVEVVNPLPRTASGKVDRRAVAALLEPTARSVRR